MGKLQAPGLSLPKPQALTEVEGTRRYSSMKGTEVKAARDQGHRTPRATEGTWLPRRAQLDATGGFKQKTQNNV